MDQWYCIRHNLPPGPYSLVELRGLIESGELRGRDQVWKDGMKAWTSIEMLPELNGFVTPEASTKAKEDRPAPAPLALEEKAKKEPRRRRDQPDDIESFDWYDYDEPDAATGKRRRKKKRKRDTSLHIPAPANRQVAGILYTVAALHLLCDTVFVMINPEQLSGGPVAPHVRAFMIAVILGMALSFVGLGSWALFQPLPPAILAVVLYVVFVALSFVNDPQLALRGIVFNIVIVIALFKAIQAGTG